MIAPPTRVTTSHCQSENQLTSGIGGVFPKGIVVGQLADFRTVNGLYKEAVVRLAVRMNRLEEVWVMMP